MLPLCDRGIIRLRYRRVYDACSMSAPCMRHVTVGAMRSLYVCLACSGRSCSTSPVRCASVRDAYCSCYTVSLTCLACARRVRYVSRYTMGALCVLCTCAVHALCVGAIYVSVHCAYTVPCVREDSELRAMHAFYASMVHYHVCVPCSIMHGSHALAMGISRHRERSPTTFAG